ncbi:MAG: helix-turn-helix domain-containing protein [Clostridia bacterium]|nr:helix-turn-helix domain-containing protein [Clostridia bacterium]
MSIGNVIVELRSEHGISQKKLADAIGISQSAIAQIEVNRNEATASTIRKLSTFFGVSADYLLGLEDDFGVKETQKALRAYDQHEITDKQTADLVKLYKALSDYNKAVVFGYVVRLIEEAGLNVKSVLRN